MRSPSDGRALRRRRERPVRRAPRALTARVGVRVPVWRCGGRCVVELFIFLKMGARVSRVMVIPIGENKHTLRVVYQELATFDLHKAQCFLNEDRERLQQCVARGFGDDATAFNVAVRNLMRQSLGSPELALTTRRTSSTTSGQQQQPTSAGGASNASCSSDASTVQAEPV